MRRAVGDHFDPEGGHAVCTASGSLAHALLGAAARTSALHRQAVGVPGPAWRPTAWTGDGTVEAVEPTTPGWSALGVQWHPELHWNDAPRDPTGPDVLGWLVAQARDRSTTAAGVA